MGKPTDPDYFRKYRASHPEYAARDRARRRAARYARAPRGDRSAEYAKRNAARSGSHRDPLPLLYPELQHGNAISFWEDELRIDIEQERWLARLEGRDEDAAVKACRRRELAWRSVTAPLIEEAA